MPLTKLSNAELADKLLKSQMDATTLRAAAERLRNIELQQLLTASEMVSAVSSMSKVTLEMAKTVESIVLAIPMSRKSSSQMSSLAGRILQGAAYDDQDVKSLAASVLAQDETPGQ